MEKDLFGTDDLFSSSDRPKPAASDSLLGDLESLISVLEKPQDGLDIPILKSFASEEDLMATLAEEIPILSDMVAMEAMDDVVPVSSEAALPVLEEIVPVLGDVAPIFDEVPVLDEVLPESESLLMPPEQHAAGEVGTHYNVAEMIAPVTEKIPAPTFHESDLSWTQTEQILRNKAGVFIQDLVDELIPQIESKLRKRLQDEFDALLQKTKQARKL